MQQHQDENSSGAKPPTTEELKIECELFDQIASQMWTGYFHAYQICIAHLNGRKPGSDALSAAGDEIHSKMQRLTHRMALVELGQTANPDEALVAAAEAELKALKQAIYSYDVHPYLEPEVVAAQAKEIKQGNKLINLLGFSVADCRNN
jgi:hypothetical protein